VKLGALPPGVRVYGVPATQFAEELGRKQVLNIVMVGFFAAVTGVLEPESMRKAVADSVPPATRELNLRAFDKGFEFGLTKLKELVEDDAETSPSLENE
jgi:2-oxoglutarate ferredoxin oxidoreductase subunit gamma